MARSGHWQFGVDKIAWRWTRHWGKIYPTVAGDPLTSSAELKGARVAKLLQQLWTSEQGQDIAEYAVMLAVILVIVVGTIRLIGSNANTVFSQVGSTIG